MGLIKEKFVGKFVWKCLFLFGLAIILMAKYVLDGLPIIPDVLDTIGITLVGSVCFNFVLSKSSFKNDCIDAATGIIQDKDLSLFSPKDIAGFYSASIRDYLFRENKFSKNETDYLAFISMMENSVEKVFCSLYKDSVLVLESSQIIKILLEDGKARVSAKRKEVFCMPIGTEYTYIRDVSALKKVSAETYKFNSIRYNGNEILLNDVREDENSPLYKNEIYSGYSHPHILRLKFDPKQIKHVIELESEYDTPPYDVFISYKVKHYCTNVSFQVSLEDNRRKKDPRFRIATEIFSSAITSSQKLENNKSERFSLMNNIYSGTTSFSTPQGLWMEPGSGYAITINVTE